MISPQNVPRGTQKAKAVTVAAPVGGWNARDSIGDMDPLDAVTLQNWWPGTNSVILRRGYSQHVTGITGHVETLMTYSSGTVNTMFGIAGTSIYNVTSSGAVGAAVVTSLTNARFQYVNFTTTGGSFLLAVNGADKLRGYDGTNWYVDGDASHDITGINTVLCNNIAVFKNRVWLIQKNTLTAWYLPINAIAGAATSLSMASIAQQGGYLVAAMTWTLDAGYGIDDYLAFITSNGEVIVWRLTDPTAPNGISMIGLWRIGAPVGNRPWIKYGGDLLIITQDGVVPMSGALQSSRLDPRVSITDKIQKAMGDAIESYGSNFGWQLIQFPKGDQLYLNVPVMEHQNQQQFVQNNITKSWCNFTGWEANCWELLNDQPYFGGNGFVGKAWNGTSDNGASIPGLVLQAFKAYGGAAQKQCKMVRYHLASNGTPALYGNVNVDYDLADSSSQLSIGAPSAGGIWGTSLWDIGVWGAGMSPSAEWQGATGIGYTFAPFMKVAANGIELQWNATDMIFEVGGAL